MIDFATSNPQYFIVQLNINATALVEASKALMEARAKLVIAEAKLMDRESELYTDYHNTVPISKLQPLIKHMSTPERKSVLIAKRDYQDLHDAYNVKVEVNNALKTALRLREEEWKNTK